MHGLVLLTTACNHLIDVQQALCVQAFSMVDPSMLDLGPIKLPGNLDRVEQRVLGDLADLVQRCTALTPRTRPTAPEVVHALETIVQREFNVDGPLTPRAGTSADGGPSPGPTVLRQPLTEVTHQLPPPQLPEGDRKRARHAPSVSELV